MDITFIVPLFKGKKYIPSIISMLNGVQNRYAKPLELVLVNDYPEETIEVGDCEGLNMGIVLKVLQNKENQGIHRTRVTGINESTGTYVVLLDQDDKISRNYIQSQIDAIGEADAVVCNARHFNKPLYADPSDQLRAISYEAYYSGNQIASPGQVMIKKEAIPKKWIDSVIENNGADDFFLWILMLYEKKIFSINNKILHLHSVSGDNASYKVREMENSVREVGQKLVYLGIWEQTDVSKLLNNISFLRKTDDQIIHDTLNLSIIREWIYLKTTKESVEAYFLNQGVCNICIYGCGILGRFLESELMDTKVKVLYYLDKSPRRNTTNVSMYGLHDILPRVDLIVVCVAYDYDKIKKQIKESGIKTEIVSLIEVLGMRNTELEEDEINAYE